MHSVVPATQYLYILYYFEDELHFLFDCICYCNLKEYKDIISYFQFLNPSLPNDEKWILVLYSMTPMQIMYYVVL